MRALSLSLLVIGAVGCGGDTASQALANEPNSSEPYVLTRDEGELLLDSKGRSTRIKVSPQSGSSLLAMGTQEMAPGSGIRVHKHDRTEEILYVAEGSGTLVLGDDRIPIHRDTTVWVPPGTWHGIENATEQMHVLWFVTPPGLENFFRGMFWHEHEAPRQLSLEEIQDLERKHDSVARE